MSIPLALSVLLCLMACQELPTRPESGSSGPGSPAMALVSAGVTVTPLAGVVPSYGTLARGITDAGLIVGSTYACSNGACSTINPHLVTWQGSSTPVDLQDPVDPAGASEGIAINRNGLLVGRRWTGSDWITFAYAGGVWTDVGGLPGDAWSSAIAVNNNGVILGSSGPGSLPPDHYFLWDNGTFSPVDLLKGDVDDALTDINDAGDVVGSRSSPSGRFAIRVRNNTTVDLPGLSGNWSWALAINNHGQIAGVSHNAGGAFDPVVWEADNSLVNLGRPAGSASCSASDINDRGQVVVWCANGSGNIFVWDSGTYYDLGPAEGQLLAAFFLNENNQVVGNFTGSGQSAGPALWSFTTAAPNTAPLAVTGGPYWGVSGASVVLDATGSTDGDGDALTFAWNFGDGSTGTGPTPNHTYARVGAYRITLTVTDVHGSATVIGTTATIEHPLPLITAGEKYSCALRVDGTAACWGASPYGASNAPSGVIFSQLAAGFATTCGLRADSTISCWGSDGSGQNLAPAGTFSEVSMGKYHGCALDHQGALACWGLNAFHAMDLPPGNYAQVSAGWLNTCAINTDGTLACAGNGYPTNGGTFVPPTGTFTQVSAGEHHACALRDNRSIVCWGGNGAGEVSGTPSAGFTTFAHSGTYEEVRAGPGHTCALSIAGVVSCWGYNGDGRATPPAGSFIRVGVGSSQSCGVRPDHTITCWGSNSNGQISVPAEFTNQPPTAQPGGPQTRLENQPAFFNGSASSDPEGATLIFAWDFGDGHTATGPTPQHAWATHGTYSVSLTVTDNLGASNTATTSITVLAPSLAWGLPSTCGHELTGVAYDGTYYYVAEGQFSLFQCITRYDANGAYLDHRVFPIDMRGLHYVPATDRLVTRHYNGTLFEVDYPAGSHHALTSFAPAPEQIQAAADPAGTSFWYVNGGSAEQRRLSDNGLVHGFPVVTNNPFVIAVSNLWLFTVQGTTVYVYEKASGASRGTVTLPSGLGCYTGWGLGASATGDRLLYVKSCDRAAVFMTGLAEPGATPAGSDVAVIPNDETTGDPAPVQLTFDNVTSAGTSSVTSGTVGQGGGPPIPAGFRVGNPPTYYDITTTATFSGVIRLCFDYTGVSHGNENNLKLLHYENGVWVDVTTSLDTQNDIICGETASLSPFLVAEPNEAPVVVSITLPESPVALNSVVSIEAAFTDVNTGDTHTATIDWEGVTTAARVTGSGGTGTVNGSHTYTAPGVYTIDVFVTDGSKAGSRSSALDAPAYIVVFDPNAGFVTGGGWISSPAGACAFSACAADGSTVGKATFGFVSRYRKGANAPDGNTQFQFSAGGLDFRSSSYQWLVVAGARAQFKGQGNIAGVTETSYGFMITAIDGALNGGGADRFRIKLWDLATAAIVYDNQMGQMEDSNAATAIGGGSIIVHK